MNETTRACVLYPRWCPLANVLPVNTVVTNQDDSHGVSRFGPTGPPGEMVELVGPAGSAPRRGVGVALTGNRPAGLALTGNRRGWRNGPVQAGQRRRPHLPGRPREQRGEQHVRSELHKAIIRPRLPLVGQEQAAAQHGPAQAPQDCPHLAKHCPLRLAHRSRIIVVLPPAGTYLAGIS